MINKKQLREIEKTLYRKFKITDHFLETNPKLEKSLIEMLLVEGVPFTIRKRRAEKITKRYLAREKFLNNLLFWSGKGGDDSYKGQHNPVNPDDPNQGGNGGENPPPQPPDPPQPPEPVFESAFKNTGIRFLDMPSEMLDENDLFTFSYDDQFYKDTVDTIDNGLIVTKGKAGDIDTVKTSHIEMTQVPVNMRLFYNVVGKFPSNAALRTGTSEEVEGVEQVTSYNSFYTINNTSTNGDSTGPFEEKALIGNGISFNDDNCFYDANGDLRIDPSTFEGYKPMTMLTSAETSWFCNKLSIREELEPVYRLPTLAELRTAYGNNNLDFAEGVEPLTDEEYNAMDLDEITAITSVNNNFNPGDTSNGLTRLHQVYNMKIDPDKNGYRLPTQYEWELFATGFSKIGYSGLNSCYYEMLPLDERTGTYISKSYPVAGTSAYNNSLAIKNTVKYFTYDNNAFNTCCTALDVDSSLNDVKDIPSLYVVSEDDPNYGNDDLAYYNEHYNDVTTGIANGKINWPFKSVALVNPIGMINPVGFILEDTLDRETLTNAYTSTNVISGVTNSKLRPEDTQDQTYLRKTFIRNYNFFKESRIIKGGVSYHNGYTNDAYLKNICRLYNTKCGKLYRRFINLGFRLVRQVQQPAPEQTEENNG